MAIIGFLDSTSSPNARAEEMNAFYEGLALTGRNGSNTMMLHAWADFDYDQLPALAQQLIDANVGVIVASGGPVSAIAAQNKTTTIPIVFTTITDPVASGLVTPGGNVTGTHGFTTDLDPVRMAGLHAIAAPGPIGVLCNPDRPFPRDPNPAAQATSYENMATALGRTAIVVDASTTAEIAAACEPVRKHHGTPRVRRFTLQQPPPGRGRACGQPWGSSHVPMAFIRRQRRSDGLRTR